MLFLALEREWCRARARAHRWQEECLLLNEEMRRVHTFFKWQASDWRQKAREWEKKPVISSSDNFVLAQADMESQRTVKDGKTAYAFRQASIRDRMVAHIVAKWKDLPSKLLHMENGDASIRIERH
jgi:hypothetical protein